MLGDVDRLVQADEHPFVRLEIARRGAGQGHVGGGDRGLLAAGLHAGRARRQLCLALELGGRAGDLHDVAVGDEVGAVVEHEDAVGGGDVPVARVLQVEAAQRRLRALVVGDHGAAHRHGLPGYGRDVAGALHGADADHRGRAGGRRRADGHRRRAAVDRATGAGDPHPVRRGRGQRGRGERGGIGPDRRARVAGAARCTTGSSAGRSRSPPRSASPSPRWRWSRPAAACRWWARSPRRRSGRTPPRGTPCSGRAIASVSRRGVDRGIERRRVADHHELARRRSRRRVQGDAAGGDGSGEARAPRSPTGGTTPGRPGGAVEGELQDAAVGAGGVVGHVQGVDARDGRIAVEGHEPVGARNRREQRRDSGHRWSAGPLRRRTRPSSRCRSRRAADRWRCPPHARWSAPRC